MAKQTGIAQFSQGRSDLHRVDPRILIIDAADDYRDQGPELDEHVDELAQSIAKIGVKKPIEVRLEDGKLVVKEGRCRTRAAIRAIEHYKADLKTVPVISVDRYANDEDLILNQVIGNSGKPFSTMEKAKIFKKLLDMGWQQSDIAEKTGMSNGRISQILGLLTMPVAVQQMVSAGHVSPSLAQATVKAADTPAKAAETLQAAVDKASAEGRKVKPADTGTHGLSRSPREITTCFENSDIDASDETISRGVVVITMPVEDWEVLRKALGL